MNQLEFLFTLLERVPSRLRHDLLDAACRIPPTLQHPKLAHDPVAVGRLEALLRRRADLIVIDGTAEHARAFLMDALGKHGRLSVNVAAALRRSGLWRRCKDSCRP